MALEMDLDGDFTTLANAELGKKRDPAMDTKGLIVVFEPFAVPDPEETAKQGRPIFREVDSVKIYTPGDRFSVIHREVWPVDKARFKKLWEDYKDGRKATTSGTPLEAAPFLTRSQVEELKFFHVRTVEALADLSDEASQKFMGINELRQRARDFIAIAKDSRITTTLRAEIDKREKENSNLQRIVKELGDRVEALSRSKKEKKAAAMPEALPDTIGRAMAKVRKQHKR
jgi:hypothetical protein